jgi:SAM-dependent methyltransferase/protein-tyrosine-phosphatase
MAEGWLRRLHGDRFEAYSAGIAPTRVDPRAILVMREAGIDLSGHRSKHVSELIDVDFDAVVTVCDNANEKCPVFPGRVKRLHAGFDDPPRLAATAATEDEALGHYRRVRDEIRAFVEKMRTTMTANTQKDSIVTKVRDRYARIAEKGDCGCSCGTTAEGLAPSDVAKKIGYDDASLAGVPDGANLGLGCGAPVGHLRLQHGETVVDLGSGAGFDSFIAAREVGPTGKVIGVDMTPAMLERARANAVKAGIANVEFRDGRLEALPIATATVDAVTSNCVINLAPDKPIVFREAARVLRPGGRMVISDIILDGELPEVVKDDVEAYVGCIAGAMQRTAYFEAIAAAGFGNVELLKDQDYLAMLGEDALPESLLGKMRENGLNMADLIGRVRSVTYRARRRPDTQNA